MAAALVDYGRQHSIEPKPENVEDFENFPGEGVFGKIDNKNIYIGNRRIGLRAGCGAGKLLSWFKIFYQFPFVNDDCAFVLYVT
jgi:cation transport ATPase